MTPLSFFFYYDIVVDTMAFGISAEVRSSKRVELKSPLIRCQAGNKN
jgi:hypothetical protein